MSAGAAPRISLWGLVEAVALLVAVATGLSLVRGEGWLLELLTHFHIAGLAGSAALVLVLSLGRRWLGAGLAGAALLAHLACVAPSWLATPPEASLSGAEADARLTLLHCNVFSRNHDAAPLLALIAARQPALVDLQELTPRWVRALAPLDAAYRYRKVESRLDNFGIGLLARRPLKGAEDVLIGEAGVPTLRATVTLGGRPLRVYVTHPPPPSSPDERALRDEQLDALARAVRAETLPVLLVGDLNVTPWSPVWARFLAASGLRDGRRGHGLLATWPAPLGPLGLPIDHVLHTPELQVLALEAGPSVGSDHRPLLATLGWAEHSAGPKGSGAKVR